MWFYKQFVGEKKTATAKELNFYITHIAKKLGSTQVNFDNSTEQIKFTYC